MMLGAGALQAIPSIAAGIGQGKALRRLKLQDTTPAAFKEGLALQRQAAATNTLPGQGMLQNRLAGTQAATVAAAQRAGSGASGVLATIAAANAQRMQGEQQLGAQGEAFRQAGQQRLIAMQGQQAAYQRADQQQLDAAKGALKEAAWRNITNGVGSFAGGLAAGANSMQNNAAAPGMAATPTASMGLATAATPSLQVPQFAAPNISGLGGYRSTRTLRLKPLGYQ